MATAGQAKFAVEFNNYRSAEVALGDRNELEVAPNTKLFRLGKKDIGVQFYETIIVEYGSSNNIVLDLSYNSTTTRGRINNVIPSGYRVHMVNKKIRLTRVHDGKFVECADNGRVIFGINTTNGEIIASS